MPAPTFRAIPTGHGLGVTYECGCPCVPTAVPAASEPGFEHCCCGKVHFVGDGAASALSKYLEERAAKRKREPRYERGEAVIDLEGRPTDIAWAFPVENA